MVNQFKSTKQIWLITILFVSIVAVVSGLFLLQKRQETRVGAQGVILKLVSTTTSVQRGSDIVVDVFMDTKGLSVTGIDLKVKFDKDKISFKSIRSSGLLPVVFKEGNVINDTAQIVLGSDVTTPKNGTGILAQIVFSATGSGVTNIGFDSSTAVAALGQNTNIVDTLTGLSITVLGPTSLPTSSPLPTSTGVPSPTSTPGLGKRGDIDENGFVNIVDIGIAIDNYGLDKPFNLKADIDKNGIVNIVDIGIIIDNYDR